MPNDPKIHWSPIDHNGCHGNHVVEDKFQNKYRLKEWIMLSQSMAKTWIATLLDPKSPVGFGWYVGGSVPKGRWDQDKH